MTRTFPAPTASAATAGTATVPLSVREAARRVALELTPEPLDRASRREARDRIREITGAVRQLFKNTAPTTPAGQWIAENARLLATAEREARDLVYSVAEHRGVGESGGVTPRPAAISRAYLDAASDRFEESWLTAFLKSFQETQELPMGELWAVKPALQLEYLARIVAACLHHPESLPFLIDGLRKLGEADWKELFEAVNVVDVVLSQDPAGAYRRMTYETRDAYRKAVSHIAKHSTTPERLVAEHAITMAREAQQSSLGDATQKRRTHVGFYLVDAGLPMLKARSGFKSPLSDRVRDFLHRNSTAYYLVGIEVVTILVVYLLLEGLDTLTPVFAGFFLLLLPATQAAVDLMNNLTSFLLRPRALPKLDFSEGIPDSCATMVAVPTLLLNEYQVRELAMDLEIRFLANRDPNLYLALLTDCPDSDSAVDERDVLINVARGLIEDLNRRYGRAGHTPFYMFHRHRVFNASEDRWMGWERKRGKLLDLNQLLRGEFDSFPVKVGDLSVLSNIRYVIALDSDTQLPRDSAHRLIGTMAHPLNQAVVNPFTQMVSEGYGILQPRIAVSVDSATRSWLASLYSGQTGFDIYTRAVSDVYQDLFGEGIYTGKGIYDVDAFRATMEGRFPENALLSHDLIEGSYARAGLVSDVELIDDYPSHFSAYSRRKHRWMRGDWQILRWLAPKVPDYHGKLVGNPISNISRWKIIDNVRRSLFEPATLALLISGWLYLPGRVTFWTAASLVMLVIPAYSGLLFGFMRAPWGRAGFKAWLKDTLETLGRDQAFMILNLIFLLYNSVLAIDAVVRSVARVFITKRRLLEWETAAESEAKVRSRSAADRYLGWMPWLSATICGIVWLLRPVALEVAVPITALWFVSPLVARWLGRAPRTNKQGLREADIDLLRASALRTWRYFRELSREDRGWLVPDNVREDGTAAERLSPTNLGFLLDARVAAVHFGYLTLPEFVHETKQVLHTALTLTRCRGHFLNWYDTRRFEPLPPLFISTVDSGNLAACLWALKQACAAFSKHTPEEETLWLGICDVARVLASFSEPEARSLGERVLKTGESWRNDLSDLEELARHSCAGTTGETSWWANELVLRLQHARSWMAEGITPELRAELDEIVQTADRLVSDMDFSFLYNPRKKSLAVGYDVAVEELAQSTYDLLASEARIASFVAIARGDVPQESWFHLGRKHVFSARRRVLVSWTGTMFEYAMPALWMRHYSGTILEESLRGAVKVQQQYGRKQRRPWGISESAHMGVEGGEYGYGPFGVPELAMKRLRSADAAVVSPYSTFLALLADPRAALANIRRMDRLGWKGQYGFHEAVDYSTGKARVVRSWMAHHQGMTLLAICNLLFDHAFQRYFHSEPYVLATERLLHERVPSSVIAEAEAFTEPLVAADEAAA